MGRRKGEELRVRVQVSLDPGVLAAIDKAASASGQDRSGYMARAALVMAGLKPPANHDHHEHVAAALDELAAKLRGR